MGNIEIETASEEFDTPDGGKLFDAGKAREFIGVITEEARAHGLNLLELMNACEWVRASCAALIAKGLSVPVADDDVGGAVDGLEEEPDDEADGERNGSHSAADDVEGHEQP